MIDCSIASASDIKRLAELTQRLVEMMVEELEAHGYEKEVPVIFAKGYFAPDWQYAESVWIPMGRK